MKTILFIGGNGCAGQKGRNTAPKKRLEGACFAARLRARAGKVFREAVKAGDGNGTSCVF